METNYSDKINTALSALTGAKTAEEVDVTLQDVKSIFELLTDELQSTTEANNALSAELEKLSKGSSAETKKADTKPINLHEYSFEHDGKKYCFNYPKLTLKSQVITPVEVVASKDLQAYLVENNHSMIKAL